jgi:hypothetical protein
VPIAEGVIFNEALRRDFREKGSEAIKPDRTMEQAASALVEQGITNAKEVERVLGRK